MFALTLRHPWPWAIIKLGKRIENRTWRATMAPGTWYAIHGGKMPRGDELYGVLSQAKELAWEFSEHFKRGDDPKLTDAILPGIVALAQHGGYVTKSASPWFDGPVGWVIADLIVLPEAIQCRGAQGLWMVPEEIAQMIAGELNPKEANKCH